MARIRWYGWSYNVTNQEAGLADLLERAEQLCIARLTDEMRGRRGGRYRRVGEPVTGRIAPANRADPLGLLDHWFVFAKAPYRYVRPERTA